MICHSISVEKRRDSVSRSQAAAFALVSKIDLLTCVSDAGKPFAIDETPTDKGTAILAEMEVLTRHGGALIEHRIREYAPELT